MATTTQPSAASAPGAPRSLAEAAARLLAAADQPVRAAFLARALNALARLAPQLEEGVLAHAAGAPSDYAALLYALEAPDALAALRREDALAAARLRGLHAREQLLQAEGGTLSTAEVARLLHITRQAVDKRRRAGRLLALHLGQRSYVYPVWQFGPHGVLPGLEEVMTEFSVESPWMRVQWFLAGNLYLDGARPLDELREGHVQGVRRAAAAYGEQGAA